MEITLVIMDKDPDYSEYLTHYFRQYYNKLFHIVGSSTLEGIESYLQDENCIFLIHETFQEDWLNDHVEVFWLCEEKMQGERFLYKYQKIDFLLHKILEKVKWNEGSLELLQGFKQNIVGIYSPIGGVGKTTMATALACLIAHHESVLYMDLEPFASNAFMVTEENKYNLSDLLLLTSKGIEDINIAIEKVVNRHDTLELYYFNPHNRYEDLLDATVKTWYRLLLALCHKYDKVILDFGTYEDEQMLTLLSLCHYLVVLTSMDPFSKMRVEKWYQYQKTMGREYNICWFANKLTEDQNCQEQNQHFTVKLPYNESYGHFRSLEQLHRSSLLEELIPLYAYIEGGEQLD